MKKMIRRITAAVLAVATTMALGLTASAVSDVFRPPVTSDYYNKISFTLDVSSATVASAAYQLKATVKENGSTPYLYPYLYLKGVLYGNGSTNSTKEVTVNNKPDAEVIVSRGTSDCSGTGFGEMHAYGMEAYGDVYGKVKLS